MDYRLLHAQGLDSFYSPIGPETNAKLDNIWNQLTNNARGSYDMVEVAQGRTISCSKSAKGVGEFTFKELCDDARGSTDYAAIGRAFTTVILRGVP